MFLSSKFRTLFKNIHLKFYFLTILLIFQVSFSFSQIRFEKGYFIDNNNQRFECLIKNYDWKNNPEEIEFKTGDASESKKADISTVKEFGITGYSKFVRVQTNIDRSPTNISNLSTKITPEWSNEIIFLKVLIEGKAKLYYYEDQSLACFFYSLTDSLVQQLIYKEYLNENNEVTINNRFRQQLWIDLRCENTLMNSLENISYRKSDIEKYVNKFNECSGNSGDVIQTGNKNKLLHLRVTPGVEYAKMLFYNGSESIFYYDYGHLTSFRLGFEMEVLLPFNKNKWGFVIEPSYRQYKSTKEFRAGDVTLNYQSIEFPIGLRHYFFLSKNTKLFLNAMFIPGWSPDFNSTLKYLEIKNRSSYAFGAGVGYKKFSTEFRYYTHQDLLSDYIMWSSDYQRLSFIVGYKIL